MTTTNPSYDSTTIALHWTTAALVVVLWIIGQTADWFPDSPPQQAYWSTHVVLGFALAAVLIWRVAWRTGGGRSLPPADSSAVHALAKTTHYLLYTLLFVVVGLGVVNAFVRGYGLYGLFHLPQIGDRSMRRSITDWHGLAANILLGLALFHAAAALVHHYIWRDGLLRRMAPGTNRVSDGPAEVPSRGL